MRSIGLLLPGALPFLLMSPALAAAEESADPRVQYRKAYEALNQKRFEEARELLRRLWENSKTYDVAASLSQAEAQLGNRAEAAQLMHFALDRVPPKETRATVERYEQALSDLRQQVASLKVQVSERNAEIRVDGRSVARSPVAHEIFVEPGEHVIEARLPAAQARHALTTVAAQTYEISLALAPAPERPKSAAPTLKDSEPADASQDSPGRSLVPAYVASGVAALGLGFGVAFGLGAQSAKQDSDAAARRVGPHGCVDGSATASDCDTAQRSLSDQRHYAVMANVGWATAAVGLGFAATWLLWPEDEEEGAAHAVRPQLFIGTSAARIGITGSF